MLVFQTLQVDQSPSPSQAQGFVDGDVVQGAELGVPINCMAVTENDKHFLHHHQFLVGVKTN